MGRHRVERSRSAGTSKCGDKTGEHQPLVWIVDDEPAVCSAVKRLLVADGHEVQVFLSAKQVAECGRPAVPCCLILDVHMPEVDGLEFLEGLNRAGIRIPTIFITGFGNVPMSVRAMKAGAVDFLPKPFDVEDLLRAVRGALAADEQQLRQAHDSADLRRRYQRLTDREREVFHAVTGGLLNKQVGAQLGVTEKTVKVHRARVMEKMDAESLAALVRMADLLRIHPPASALAGSNVDVQPDLTQPPIAPFSFDATDHTYPGA
jgi:FixJ family two-component response regulator